MRRFFAILTLIAACFTASAQVEHSIVLDSNSFRAVQTDALTGVNIDPIDMDSSRQLCARVKIFFHRMTREQMEQLEPVFPSGTIDCIKRKVADDNTMFILEFTAKPSTKFYLNHPTFGVSNEVEFDFEGGREYQLEASLNQTFSIVVNSNKPNVDIYLDNRYRGQTDASNSLTIKDVMIGRHKLKVTYGSISYEQEIDVNSGSISFRQDVNKEAGEPQFVVFTVEPQSAVVTIGGKHYTLTDGAMRTVLNSGTYNYTVSAVGYHSKSDSFTVAGEKVTKNITLTADAATVTLTVADNAEIWVNGEKKGSGRWSGMLNSGPYIFEAKKAGYKTSTISKQISSAQPNQSFTLPAPTPIVGSIMVDGNPINADVALDGKSVGQVPLKLNNILIGKHTITISKDGYKTNTQTVTVAEGKSTTVNVALTKLNAQSSNTTTAATPTYPYITAKESIIIDTQNISSIVDSDNHMGIGRDMSYRPCARIKILFDKMSADEIKKLMIRCTNNSQMITKAFVEPNQNVLIFEITAKLNTNIYLQHPSWGNSNTVTIDLQPYGEYTLMARRNISITVPSHSVSSTPATPATTATTKTYKVGDYYNDGVKDGVVFEVSADGKHGKIVSMKQSGKLQWSSDATEQTRLIGASSQTDGTYNMAKVKAISGWQSKYPAFKWCADLGKGWYIPSIEELKTFILNTSIHDAVNRTLSAIGGTKLYNIGTRGEGYWSSTEYNKLDVWSIFMINGSIHDLSKSPLDGGCDVRAVAKF